MADQFRADALGCVGGYARTPNLDKLASTGWLFTNAFANSAECVPSRISLATGLYPHQTGIDRNNRCTLNPDVPNWMQAIAAASYRTSLFGKTHLHPHEGDIRDRLPLMHRYGLQTVDEITGPRAAALVRSNMTELWQASNVYEDYRTDLKERFATRAYLARPSPLPLELYYDSYVGRAAASYLEQLAKGAPWFCWVSFGGPHEPWDAPEPYASMYAPEQMPLPRPRTFYTDNVGGLLKELYNSVEYCPDMTASDIAAMRANYAGNVTLIDGEIGRILETIRRRGELDESLIIFTSDHGEMNGDHGLIYKANFLDPAIKIPLIVVGPGSSGFGHAEGESAALVELMDVGATLVDYAEAEQPMPTQACSLRPLIENRTSVHRQFAVSEFAAHTCVVGPRLKVEFDPLLELILAFDRNADPEEQRDISRDPAYQEEIAAVSGWLARFRVATPAISAVL